MQGMNFAQAFGKMFGAFARGAQGAEAQHAAAASIAFDHAVAGRAGGGGIDAEDTQAITIRSGREWHGIECTAARRGEPQLFGGSVLWHSLQSVGFRSCKDQPPQTEVCAT